jgi:[ribosomal protein S5]-alanine N-acetyltransferase
MDATYAPTLTGARVILRAPLPSDVNARIQAGEDADLIRGYGGEWRARKEFPEKDAEQWYRRALSRPIAWIIVAADEPIGNCYLELDRVKDRCSRFSIGIWLPTARGRGYGTETTEIVLAHAFSTLDLHRVELRVLERNLVAVSCYERCGFVVEGKERETAILDGEWQNDLIMSILKQEWLLRHTSRGV